MYNTSHRIVKDTMAAEDIMQESFLSAFSRLDSYSGIVSFGAWLKKIVVNASIDYLKKQKATFVSVDEIEIDVREEQDLSNHEEIKVKADMIKQAIQMLPEGYRIILSLYLLEGYDHDEISEIMNITGSTSRSQYTRARRKLLEIIQHQNSDDMVMIRNAGVN